MSLRIAIIALAACALGVWGADRGIAARCFEQAPDQVLPMLSTNTRLDMLDYFEAGSDRPSPNSLGGDARITAADSAFMAFDAGTGEHWQMLVLEDAKGPSHIIGMIETLDTPIPDSHAAFYNSRWEKLGGVFTPPVLADWVASGSKADVEAVAAALPFITAEYTFDPSTLTLTATPTIARYFVSSDWQAAEALALLRPSIVYQWDARKLRYVKK